MPSNSILVANYDFESSDTGAAWHAGNAKASPAPLIQLDEQNPHSGKAALKFQSAAAASGSSFIFTGISLPAVHSQNLRLHFYARSDGDAEINLLERDGQKVIGWCGGKQTLMSIGAGTDWKEYSIEVPVNEQARVLTLMLRLNNSAEQKTVWIDDLSLENADSSIK